MEIIGSLISFVLLLISVSVHEFAHGWTAYKLGDNTAKYAGRLTLNPLAHIDPIGTILLPLMVLITTSGRFIFGAAKPVPINYSALKNPKRDILWIGLSGPLANFALAASLSIVLRLLPINYPEYATTYTTFMHPSANLTILKAILISLIWLNVLLGVFNLIPIPPLDGSRVIMGLLPPRIASSYAKIEPYGLVIVILLIALRGFDLIISPIVNKILAFLIIN